MLENTISFTEVTSNGKDSSLSVGLPLFPYVIFISVFSFDEVLRLVILCGKTGKQVTTAVWPGNKLVAAGTSVHSSISPGTRYCTLRFLISAEVEFLITALKRLYRPPIMFGLAYTL